MDNVTDLNAYRRRPPEPMVSRDGDRVTLTVGITEFTMSLAYARELGKDLVAASGLKDDESDSP